MEIGFPEAVLTVGLLLLVAASLSGLMHGTVLSISVLSVAAGVVLAEAGVVSVDPGDAVVIHLGRVELSADLVECALGVGRQVQTGADLWARRVPCGVPVIAALAGVVPGVLVARGVRG